MNADIYEEKPQIGTATLTLTAIVYGRVRQVRSASSLFAQARKVIKTGNLEGFLGGFTSLMDPCATSWSITIRYPQALPLVCFIPGCNEVKV